MYPDHQKKIIGQTKDWSKQTISSRTQPKGPNRPERRQKRTKARESEAAAKQRLSTERGQSRGYELVLKRFLQFRLAAQGTVVGLQVIAGVQCRHHNSIHSLKLKSLLHPESRKSGKRRAVTCPPRSSPMLPARLATRVQNIHSDRYIPDTDDPADRPNHRTSRTHAEPHAVRRSWAWTRSDSLRHFCLTYSVLLYVEFGIRLPVASQRRTGWQIKVGAAACASRFNLELTGCLFALIDAPAAVATFEQ
jgi:hypothetical protein